MHKILCCFIMIKTILKFVPFMNSNRTKRKKDSFMTRLLKEDTNLSVMNFFLMATLAVGVVLLIVPIVGMLVDIYYNHTMTINLSDMAVYIGSVAGIFAAGGLSSAWTEFAYSKYDVKPITEEDMARSERAAEEIEDTYYNEDICE